MSAAPNPAAGADSDFEVPKEKLPRHIAVIMDGNGRWAQQRRLPRIEGHRRGAQAVGRVTRECDRLGIQQLTLYCLSSENWKRPQDELELLMQLLEQFMVEERGALVEHNLVLQVIGRRDRIPDEVQREIDKSIEMTRGNSGLSLCLAINYGSRMEIIDAVRAIADQVSQGSLKPSDIDERVISDHLYTAGMPDPDLLIRTAGEMRVSNYLLWQISYAELWVTQRLWPDFEVDDLHLALRDYAGRSRRYGGLDR